MNQTNLFDFYIIDSFAGGGGASTMSCAELVATTMKYVKPNTVGQYTGLTDINDKKIFDGDIIKHYNEKINPHKFVLSIVKWDCSELKFYKADIEDCTNWAMSASCKYEVIGNIHDNPELLEVKNNG